MWGSGNIRPLKICLMGRKGQSESVGFNISCFSFYLVRRSTSKSRSVSEYESLHIVLSAYDVKIFGGFVSNQKGTYLKDLIATAKSISQSTRDLPFSVYTSRKEQVISNVPIVKPLLIFVLSGTKTLGKNNSITCSSGSFVFLSNNPKIDMRNIPSQDDYFAILVEFEFSDFDSFTSTSRSTIKHVEGEISPLLQYSLEQFVNFSSFAPQELLKNRKKEILEILYNSGHNNLAHLVNAQTLSEKIYSLIMSSPQENWSVEEFSERLFMSASTLRRRLKAEGTSIIELRNRARLGVGLHLLQTTVKSIGDIAELCGFQSQSRFSEQFKILFNMTPRELRKTKMAD